MRILAGVALAHEDGIQRERERDDMVGRLAYERHYLILVLHMRDMAI